MIVKRGIALGYALELVVEVDHNLTQRQHEMQFHAVPAHILLVDKFATLVEAKGHDWTDIVGGSDYRGTDVRLFDMVDECLLRKPRRIVYFLDISLFVIAHIGNVWHCPYDIHVELAVKTFLYYFHV